MMQFMMRNPLDVVERLNLREEILAEEKKRDLKRLLDVLNEPLSPDSDYYGLDDEAIMEKVIHDMRED
ncbi:MAG: hypothetical protein HQL56_00735 [Magnetococcales bacterium]|nr:hypothetical protein [Magnetococcales bacterium]